MLNIENKSNHNDPDHAHEKESTNIYKNNMNEFKFNNNGVENANNSFTENQNNYNYNNFKSTNNFNDNAKHNVEDENDAGVNVDVGLDPKDEHVSNNSIEVNDLEMNIEMETDLNNRECLDVSSNKMATSEHVPLENFKGTFQIQQNLFSNQNSHSNNFNNNKKTFLNISTKDILEDNFSHRLKREVGYDLGVDFFKKTDFKQILERKNDSNDRSNSLGRFKTNESRKYKKLSNYTFLVDLNSEENGVNRNERPLSTISKKLNPKLQDNPKLKQLIDDFYTKEEHINYHNLNIHNLKNYLSSSNKSDDICKLLYDKELSRSKFNELKYSKNINNLQLYSIKKSKILGLEDYSNNDNNTYAFSTIGTKSVENSNDLPKLHNKKDQLIVQTNLTKAKFSENGNKDSSRNSNSILIRSISNKNNIKPYYGTIEKLKRTFSPMIENVNKRKNVNNMLENSLVNLSDTVKFVKGINPRMDSKVKIYDYDVILNKLNTTDYKINQKDFINERTHGRIKSSDLLITIDSKQALNNDIILETNSNLGTAIKKKYDDFNDIVDTIPDSLTGPKLFFIEKTNVDPLCSLSYKEEKGKSYEDYLLKLQKELKSCVSLPEPHENAKVINSSVILNHQSLSSLSYKLKPNGNQEIKSTTNTTSNDIGKLSNLDYLKFGILNKSLTGENNHSLSSIFKPPQNQNKKNQNDSNTIKNIGLKKSEFKTDNAKKNKFNDLKFWNNSDITTNFGDETLTEKYLKENVLKGNASQSNFLKLDILDGANNNLKENIHKKQMQSMAKSLKAGFDPAEIKINLTSNKNRNGVDKTDRVKLEDTKSKFNFYIENNNVFDKIGVIKGNLSINRKKILKNPYIK